MARLCLLGAMLLAAGGARADVLGFTYTFDNGDVFGARLTGVLEADGNTFDVSGYDSLSYNGADVTFTPDYLQSYSDFDSGVTPSISGTGRLTLDGSFADLINYSNLGYGFDLIVNAGFEYNDGRNIGVFGFSDLEDQPFVAASYTAALVPVPEPGTVALVGAALLGMGLLRRRVTGRAAVRRFAAVSGWASR